MQALLRTLIALLLFGIPSTVTVRGRILDREGLPMVKAKVAYTETSNGKTYSAVTDKKGEFVLAGVNEGYYRIVITNAAGERVFSGNRNIHLPNEDERWRRAPGEESNDLNVDLSTASPTGQLLDSAGNAGRGKPSKEQLEQTRKENANSAKLNRLIAELHAQLNERAWPDATQTLQQLIELDPNRWEFYQNLGTIQSNLAHYDDAVRTFAKGVEVAQKTLGETPSSIKSDIGGMLIAEGDAYNRLDKLDQALDLYRKAAAIMPQPAMAYHRACNALNNHGQAEAAIAACNQAIAADPGQWDFYQLLAGAQVMGGKQMDAIATYDKGIEMARKAVETQPDSPRPKTGLGQMLTAKGNLYSQMRRFDDAIAAFQEAAQLAAYPALPYFNLCATYYNTNRMEDAVMACDKAISSDPGMAEAYYIKGAALFGKGQRKEGKYVAPPETRDVLNKYLGLSPFGTHADAARALLEKLDEEVDTGEKHAKKK
ncbi:MAG TPA: tetratricopeptide repeat protein [Candidatus Angelobacter sp.]